LTFARHDLIPGGATPAPLDTALLASIRDQVAASGAPVAVGWIEAAADGAKTPAGPYAIAIRVGGATGLQLRNAYLAEILMRAPTTEILALRGENGYDNLYLPDAILSWARDVLYVVPLDPIGSGAEPTWPTSAFLDAIPASPYPQVGAEMPIDGVPIPLPSIPGDAASRHDDPELEALLPASVDDHPMVVLSLDGPIAVATVYLALPMLTVDLGGVDVDARTSTAAYARSDELDTFSLLAARVPGFSARRLLGAWIGTTASERAGSTLKVGVLDVDGRTLAIVNDDLALHVRDGLVVELRYLDVGDTLGTPAPRPALRDLAIPAVRAMPAP